LFCKYARILGDFESELFVDTVTANIAEIVTFIGEEKLVDNSACCFFIGRLRISKLTIDMFYRFLLRV
jgi:hypothetical protein